MSVLLFIIAVGLGIWLYPHIGELQSSPLKQDRTLHYLSRAAADAGNGLIVIGDSRQEIVDLSGDGRLLNAITQSNGDGRRHDFTDVGSTSDGRIIALDTVLDEYGLYVQEERILSYLPGESASRVLYSLAGDGSDKRVGQVKGLQVEGDTVHFYIDRDSSIQLYQMNADNGSLEESYQFSLPENRYLSEIAGYQAGQIYYSTKRGAIYHVQESGVSERIYPLSETDRTNRNFPESLQLDDSGRIYFIDRLVNAVTSMDAANPSDLRTELSQEDMNAKFPNTTDMEIADISLDHNGNLIVLLDDRMIVHPLNGEPGREIYNVSYGKGGITDVQQIWGGSVLLLVVFLLFLRFFYAQALGRRVSLFFKQVFAIVPILMIAMLLLSNFIYDSFSNRMESEMQRELTLLARNGQSIIDGDQLNRLESPDDYRNEDYQALYDNMTFLFDSEDPSIRKGLYSTLYKYEDGKLYIIMDDDDGVNMFKPFPLSDENKLVLDNGEVYSDRWEDATGKWLYAIGPVYDSAGNVVGVYETGSDLNVLYHANQTIYKNILRNIGLISLALIAVVLAVTYYLLSSLRSLRKSVMAMANGNWDVRVKVRTQDEVGDLGEQFNLMAKHIRNYIKDITSFSEASHRFVPQQIFKYLGKNGITEVNLGDQVQHNMSVMVANIRGFNHLSKQLSPKQNFDLMNAFLKRFSPFVREEEGLISKYLGAGFLALFPRRAEDALRAAVAIRRELSSFNESLKASGLRPVDMGMAMHKGPLMLGIVGEEQRMEGNVISDDVNVTTALERMSDTMGASIIVTRTVFDQLRSPERFRHRKLGRIQIESKDEFLELIDVYEGDSDAERQLKDRTKAMFEKGILLCQEGRFFDARETFIEVIKANRTDKAAKLYFYLCDEYYQKGSSEGWNGALAV